MPSDTSSNSNNPPRWKFRVRFAKSGDLRFVSHHDLMHVMERMFRRADLTLATSQGFNPRPKMTFALSLGLGIAGLNEVLEMEAALPLGAEDVQARLTRQCPPGLRIHSVRAIDFKCSARVRRALYALPLLTPIDDLLERCQSFLAQSECWVERARPHPRRVNLRPFVDELRSQADRLTMALWITPNGAARAEELIAALGLSALLEEGAVIERTDLELCDEMPPGTSDPPVIRAAMLETTTNDEPLPVHRTAIMDNPMSFDS
jgi:radical SAM-linked protein